MATAKRIYLSEQRLTRSILFLCLPIFLCGPVKSDPDIDPLRLALINETNPSAKLDLLLILAELIPNARKAIVYAEQAIILISLLY